MQYEPRKLDRIAAKLGTSTAALEQYLQLKQREADKTELEEKVVANIKELVVPYIEKIKQQAGIKP